MIRKSKTLSNQSLLLLDNIKSIFESKMKKMDDLFEFINLSLIYGQTIIMQDSKKLDQVFF